MLSSVLARLTGRSVMKRSELADLAAFVAVGELLSFRAAAARLGITRSALSHAMQQLEKCLDVRLLHRSTRHVALTDQGRRLFERLRAAFGGIHQALAELDRERASASGLLRLHISAGALEAGCCGVAFLSCPPRRAAHARRTRGARLHPVPLG